MLIIISEIEPQLILIGIVLIAIIAFCIYYFSTKQQIIRTLTKLPNKSIGGLKPNDFTKFTGKALHIKEPLIAPFSKRKCVFYVIKIQQKKNTGKSSYWDTIINETKIQDFFLEKNSDYVMVRPTQNPKNYKSYLVVDKRTNSGTFKEPTPEFKTLLNHYNIKSENYFGFNKQLRYTEAIIEIGEEITVAGIAKWKKLNTPVKGYNYSKIAALESTDKQKLIITDLPNIKSKKRL